MALGTDSDTAQLDPTQKASIDSIVKGIETLMLAGASSTTKAEDAAHASGDTGVMALAVRKDAATGLAANGDYIPLIVDATGQLWIHVGAIDAGTAIIGKVGIDQTTDGTTNAVNVKTSSGAGATIGATNGAAVVTDADGTLQQYLRGLIKLFTGTGAIVVVNPATAIYHGKKTVAVPGTEEALGATQALKSGVRIKALSTNTGLVYVGVNGVSSGDGYQLSAGDELYLEIADRATVYIDVAVAGEGVTYIGS